jgi:hypothetical protein
MVGCSSPAPWDASPSPSEVVSPAGNDIAGAGSGDAGSAGWCPARGGRGPRGRTAAVDVVRAARGAMALARPDHARGARTQRRCAVPGAPGRVIAGAEGGGTQGQMTMMPAMTMMTESAARHVLAAVTQRARKLFVLMGRRQLDALADAGGSSAGGGGGGGRGVVEPTTPAEAGEVAIPYDATIILPA